MINDGLWEAYRGFHMGIGAEMIVEKYGLTRQEQDAFAAASHQKAAKATAEGLFNDQILPVEIPAAKKGEAPRVFDKDEGIRPDTTVEVLAKLRPAFKDGGTVTAGNAPGVSDGAAAAVVMSAEAAKARGLKAMAAIRGQVTAGREPEWFGLAPIDAILKLMPKVGWELGSVDLFELNEAFSAQAIAVIRDLKLDRARVNVHGGAVALGHPIGASGAAVLVKLLYAMEQQGKKRGVAALCLGGGNAVAMAVERAS
jgi:acetyl-CoA C-acetyltransferase